MENLNPRQKIKQWQTQRSELWLQMMQTHQVHLTPAGGPLLCTLLHAQRDDFSPERSDPTSVLQRPLKTRRGNARNASKAQTKHVRVWRRCGEQRWLLFPPGTRPSWSLHPQCWSPHLSKRKKKTQQKKQNRKKSSLKHSQRRQKLCQRLQGENSNHYKHQHKGKQKTCFKDLCLSSLTDSHYTFSRLWDFSRQHFETRNDSAFTTVGEQTRYTATGTCAFCALLFSIWWLSCCKGGGCLSAITKVQWPWLCPKIGSPSTVNYSGALVIILEVASVSWAVYRANTPTLGAGEPQVQSCHPFSASPHPEISAKAPMPPSSPKTTAAFPQIPQHPSPDHYCLLAPCTCPCPISDLGLCTMPPPSAPLPQMILPHSEGLDITTFFFFNNRAE